MAYSKTSSRSLRNLIISLLVLSMLSVMQLNNRRMATHRCRLLHSGNCQRMLRFWGDEGEDMEIMSLSSIFQWFVVGRMQVGSWVGRRCSISFLSVSLDLGLPWPLLSWHRFSTRVPFACFPSWRGVNR